MTPVIALFSIVTEIPRRLLAVAPVMAMLGLARGVRLGAARGRSDGVRVSSLAGGPAYDARFW